MSDIALFDAIVEDLSSLKPGRDRPSRYQAREVLLHLGQAIEAHEDVTLRLSRLSEAVAPVQEAWLAALDEEINLAGAEHILGVDPRFLDHPSYDLEYTLGARQRLEWRLLALEALAVPVPPGLMKRIIAADELLAAHRASLPDKS
ncbi:MAG: hypothetical protein QF724_07355 [Planctomycetota bacterium]|jgi:hypothetical protein|nr:hypothetical protein [Planctomycetota bacterium]MDP6519032.1 hypothetical protein [Planctomycetota bacterium]MDP6838736.1 hypothetical protein [Planctomycetota bacterium]MDP6955147.1 hypothetical protein [Planctomycetota bacterium]